MEKLKVALIQANLEWENSSKNIKNFTALIDNIKNPVDLIVLPEMFTTGFSMNAESLAEEEQGNAVKWMISTAKNENCAITGSLIIKEEGNFYNRLFFVFPDGSYKKYDKKHTFTLAKEDKTYTAGTHKLIVEYKGWRFCPLICYDLRFPVWARNTEDYDVLIYVANWPKTRVHAWDTLLQARAIENMSYCIGVNRVGEDANKYQYSGHTNAYDCLGKNLLSMHNEDEFIQIIELDKNHLQETRESLKFLEDRDHFILE